MPRSLTILEQVRIDEPCPVRWHAMGRVRGEHGSRFCERCQKHVHDIASMTRGEAEQILTRKGEGEVCLRICRRRDGSAVTADWREAHTRFGRWRGRVAAALAAAATFLASGCYLGATLGRVEPLSDRCVEDRHPCDEPR